MAATLRRVTFKLVVGFLEAEQSIKAFRAFFELDPPPSLARLDFLTPGDFAVVKKRAIALGEHRNPAALVAMLREEIEAKRTNLGQPLRIGFAN